MVGYGDLNVDSMTACNDVCKILIFWYRVWKCYEKYTKKKNNNNLLVISDFEYSVPDDNQ